MHREVVHGQLHVQLQVLPLAKACELVRVLESLEAVLPQVGEDLLHVRVEEVGRHISLQLVCLRRQLATASMQQFLHVFRRIFRIQSGVGEKLAHDEGIVDLTGLFHSILRRIQLLIALNLLVEFELRQRLRQHVLAKVLEQEVAQPLVEDFVKGNVTVLIHALEHHTTHTGVGQLDLLARSGRRGALGLLHGHQVGDVGQHGLQICHLE